MTEWCTVAVAAGSELETDIWDGSLLVPEVNTLEIT